MQKNFLKTKIESGFEQERELLQHEVTKKEKLPILLYVRPLFFTLLLTITLLALGINGFAAIKYFITN